MLRITMEESGSLTTFRLEGKLKGEWVQELERCWMSAKNGGPEVPFSVDLSNVNFVDENGTALLSRMVSERVSLQADGNLLISSLVKEIVHSAMTQRRVPGCSPTQ